MSGYATIDIETTGLNRYKDEVTYIGIGYARDISDVLYKGFILDMRKSSSVDKLKQICNEIRHNEMRTVFQNGKFDTLFIELKYGITIPIHEDIMLMATAYDLAAEHGLKPMAKKYLGVPDWDISKKEKTSGAKSIVPYLKCDVKYTWMLFQYFNKVLTAQHRKIYRELLMPAYRMYRDVERNGAYIDKALLSEVITKYKGIEQQKLKELNSHYKINWNSSAQVQHVLFDKDKENLPVLKVSKKTGLPAADKGVLNRLAMKGAEIPQLITEYKAANTLNKMFLNRWPEDSSYDGRIHPSFNLTNVVTGRTSCSNPNFQQVPRTKDVRGIYRAPEGRLFFEADYSQLELRIAADYANEPTMIDIYNHGGDIHTTTAKLMTNGREPTKEERGKAKAVNFGFLYGMLAKKFVAYAYDSYHAVFTPREAEEFRAKFFAKYSRLLPWHEEMKMICEAEGGVANRFGRFRKLPDVYSSNKWERMGAERRAINTPVQGTGSDLLISAATQLNRELKSEGLKIVGTVHDSILGEFWAEDEEWIVPYIRKVMAHPQIMDEFGVTFKVPLDCDVGVGPWGTH